MLASLPVRATISFKEFRARTILAYFSLRTDKRTIRWLGKSPAKNYGIRSRDQESREEYSFASRVSLFPT